MRFWPTLWGHVLGRRSFVALLMVIHVTGRVWPIAATWGAAKLQALLQVRFSRMAGT
ncbi:hypothetical protein GCM10023213_37380 [Prosthecobacter algae]|uniref:Uncharacterized protein n=1 Tax=Prosthecobacter algae TaxID=1144682 RepID=A0ABP9PF31_9BACT